MDQVLITGFCKSQTKLDELDFFLLFMIAFGLEDFSSCISSLVSAELGSD